MTTYRDSSIHHHQLDHDQPNVDRARTLSDEWVERMSQRALLLEAHHFEIHKRLVMGVRGGTIFAALPRATTTPSSAQ
jgi:hypothetical protein